MYVYDETEHRFIILSTQRDAPEIDALTNAPAIVLGTNFIYRRADKSTPAKGIDRLHEDADILTSTSTQASDPRILVCSATGTNVYPNMLPQDSQIADWRLCRVQLQTTSLRLTFVNLSQLQRDAKAFNTLQLNDVSILHMECLVTLEVPGATRVERYTCSTDPCTYQMQAKAFRVNCQTNQLSKPGSKSPVISSQSNLSFEHTYS